MLQKRQPGISSLPDVRLQGFRVVLRPPRISDWPQWQNIRRRNQSYLKPYEPTWPDDALAPGFFEERLERQSYDWKMGTGHAFLIFKRERLPEEGEILIGGININHVCRSAAQYASLGYWIDEQHQGEGYMAESLRLIARYCFEALELHRLNAACLTHNDRSKNLLLRAGFAEEGFAKHYLQIDGRWQDHNLFGLTVESWREQQRT